MRDRKVLRIAFLFVIVMTLACSAQAQMIRPEEYIESVQKEYLEPNGLDYEQLDEVTQARAIGYSLGIKLLAAGMDFEKIDQIQRMHYMFLNRLGRRKPASKEMNLAYIGRYDAEMRKLLGGAAAKTEEEEKPQGGFLSRLKDKK